jgi:D-glycero-D-manno-heptose 1,7-bisphosphate phosphatase
LNKAVFFDRDGTLTTSKFPPKNISDIKFMPNIEELLLYLKNNDFLIFCITNQPDIARGTKTYKEVEQVNDVLWIQYPEIIKFIICPHDNQDMCACRKPKPGMLYYLSLDYDIILEKSWVIGDSWKDIMAGKNAGCKTIFFNYKKYGELNDIVPDFYAKSTGEIIDIFERNKD